MLTRAIATVHSVAELDERTQEIETEFGLAINYVTLTGWILAGNSVLLNRTATTLGLGTGGYDFVIANLTAGDPGEPVVEPGHIVKNRYTPMQHTVLTLEEQDDYAEVWDRGLAGFPVICGQLHSQVAHSAAALAFAGKRVAYIMTDAAALPIGFSSLVRRLKDAGILTATITAGQASGGDFETVTVASALLAAKHIANCDAAIVCQGPGNAGTGTKYGFSGLEQATHLTMANALGGAPIAVARMSEADTRERHRGLSHHTLTSLSMTPVACAVPVPNGVDASAISSPHSVHEVSGGAAVVAQLLDEGVRVTSMGRKPPEDLIFFEAAATAGLWASLLIDSSATQKAV